uniref:Uncharacterized protein n=1 Tax=Arundo donax TaxID=35708 RepID=A0A0A9AHC9_ARUDO
MLLLDADKESDCQTKYHDLELYNYFKKQNYTRRRVMPCYTGVLGRE